MGLFRTIRGTRNNVLFAAGLSGFYVMAAAFLHHNGMEGLEALGFAFLGVLILFGLWTGSPVAALVTMGGITWLWIVAALQDPSLAPELAGRRLQGAYGIALAPVLAMGLGVLTRSLLFRPHRRDARASD